MVEQVLIYIFFLFRMLNIKHKVADTKKIYIYDTFHILIGHQHKIKHEKEIDVNLLPMA